MIFCDFGEGRHASSVVYSGPNRYVIYDIDELSLQLQVLFSESYRLLEPLGHESQSFALLGLFKYHIF